MTLLGIDLGGTKWALAAGDAEGRPIEGLWHVCAHPDTGDARSDLAILEREARALADRVRKAGHPPIARIGLAAPGPVDSAQGLLLHPPNLRGWGEVRLAEFVRDRFEVPTHVENDANAATLAEWRHGAGQGARHGAFLTMSTGVGAGVILDGRLYRGATGNAGELGHVPIEFPGRPCHCGRTGCLEAYCGGRAWQEALRLPGVVPPDSAVLEQAGGREAITPVHVVAAAHGGDAFAVAELARWTEFLSRGLVQVLQILDLERIVLGTIARAAGEALCFGPLRARVEAQLWPHQRGRVEILPSPLEDRALLAGLAVAEYAETRGDSSD